MTTGQRIARKRKEAALSQEALGAELGVSRQSIYKWESDAALPEIDKLVALSRRFGVTVGWLLGVEETPEAEQPAPDGELTEAQLKMVEEIAERYLAAQPKPKPFRKWLVRAAIVAVICVAINLFDRLDKLNLQYRNLSNAVSSVESSVNHQINGISDRVEEILKQQNNLTAEYGTELLNVAPAGGGQGTAVFSAYAVPKNYVEGMTAEFQIQEHGSGGGANIVPVSGTGRRFAADAISCELTDEITLSVVFHYPDGTQETQVLDTYTDLYSESLPAVSIHDYYLQLMGMEIPDGTLAIEEGYVTVSWEPGQVQGHDPAAKVADIQVGIFRNQTLLRWLEACDQPEHFHGDYDGEQFYRLTELKLSQLSMAESIAIAALVTDSYGRQFMACDVPYVMEDPDAPHLTYPSVAEYDRDSSHWSF